MLIQEWHGIPAMAVCLAPSALYRSGGMSSCATFGLCQCTLYYGGGEASASFSYYMTVCNRTTIVFLLLRFFPLLLFGTTVKSFR